MYKKCCFIILMNKELVLIKTAKNIENEYKTSVSVPRHFVFGSIQNETECLILWKFAILKTFLISLEIYL